MKEHIYILDDHPIIAEGLAKLLTLEEKYQITIGKHYSELYNYIDNQTPSLLIIDYELQDKTVLELLPYLHKKIPQTPVLIYTMHTEFWIIKQLIKKHADKTHAAKAQITSLFFFIFSFLLSFYTFYIPKYSLI